MNISSAKHSMRQQRYDSAYVTLMSVLIVAALGSAISVSLLLLGLGTSRTSFSVEQSYQAKSIADACAEEGLQQIRSSTGFTGSGNITFTRGSCTYTVTNGGAQNRTVIATGTVGTVVRKVTVTIDTITPKLNVTSWLELP